MNRPDLQPTQCDPIGSRQVMTARVVELTDEALINVAEIQRLAVKLGGRP